MIFISHRGNIDSKDNILENTPDYIDSALDKGYDVEIDVWSIDGLLYTGHDAPIHKISVQWLIVRSEKIWLHCKNVEAMVHLSKYGEQFNYFWHENDKVTLTSKKYMWVYPKNQPIPNSIAVLPELHNDDCSVCFGICSDYIEKYRSDFLNNRGDSTHL